MSEMLVVIPSRGRPENIARAIKALADTNSRIDLKVGVDNDDPKLDEYKKLDVNLVIGERKKFAATYNDIVMDNLDYKYISFFGDDHVPRSDRWDEQFRRELDKMGTGVVYGNDLVMGEAIATEWTITSDIPKTLGYAVPKGFVHLYVDNYFMKLGESIGKLSYLSDVVVQHMHPCAGTAVEDLTYREANSQANWSNDRIRFEKYMSEELASDAEKLRRLLK